VVRHLHRVSRGFAVVLVEGAGGWLSPLGTDFASRELAAALNATPVLVAPNRLGVVNLVRLTLEALPARLAGRARVVLREVPEPERAAPSNAALLGEFFPPQRIHRLPWLGTDPRPGEVPLRGRLRIALMDLVHGLLP